MKKYLSFLLAGGVLLILSFQNCNGSQFSDRKLDSFSTRASNGSGYAGKLKTFVDHAEKLCPDNSKVKGRIRSQDSTFFDRQNCGPINPLPLDLHASNVQVTTVNGKTTIIVDNISYFETEDAEDLAYSWQSTGTSTGVTPTPTSTPTPTATPSPTPAQVASKPRPVTQRNYLLGLYISMFDRLADQSGYNFWLEQIGSSPAFQNNLISDSNIYFLADSFAANPAFDTAYSQMDDTAYINKIYQNSGGPADSLGFNYWYTSLQSLKASSASVKQARAHLLAQFVVGILTWDATLNLQLDPMTWQKGVNRQNAFFLRLDQSSF